MVESREGEPFPATGDVPAPSGGDGGASGVGSSCPQCQAACEPGQRFCRQCGAEIEAAASAVRTRRRRAASTGDAAERASARREFGRIKSVVMTVRGVFAASAVMAMLSTIVVFRLRQRLAGEGLDTDLEHGLQLLGWMGIGEIVLLVLGALLVVRAPLLWTVVAACYWTLNTLLGWWLDDFAIAPWTLVRLLLLLSFWFAVGQAARLQRLMAADPSLQIVRKGIDPKRRVAGGVADEARARARQARGERWRTIGKIGAAVVVLSLALWFVLREVSKPPTVDASLDRFAAAWRADEWEPLGALCADGPGGQTVRTLREGCERRGWQRPAIELVAPAVEDVGGITRATYRAGAHEFVCVWRRDENRWRIVDIDLPPLVVPPLADGLQAFRAAWQQTGTEPVLAMLRPSSRDRIGGALQRLLQKREWHEQRPRLGDEAPGPVRDGRARVRFAVGDAELSVQFEFWHPRWHVTGVSVD
jgi:hypothetical protein